MNDDRLGFAIVGCGVIAPMHARALSEMPDARLVAVVDTVAEKAAELGGKWGVDHCAELDRVLERPDVNVVNVCVPSGLHAEIGVRAAQAGKHVVVEKPIDISLEAADRLIEACRGAGVTLGVISQQRWNPGVQRLRRLLDEGSLGRLLVGDAIIKWYRSQEYYDSGDWRGTWALDGGGCLMNQGVHYVDLLQWMMGPVDKVVARTATAAHERIEVEDIALALLTFASGAMGVLQGSTAVFPGLPERLEVSGTEGTAIVTKGDLTYCEIRGGAPALDSGAEAEGDSGTADPSAIGHRLHRAQLTDFVAALRTGRAPLVTGEEARKPLEIILAVYEAARTRSEITLPR